MGRVTIHDLREMKRRGEKIAVLTAYDYSMARILDEVGVPVLLVGDSVGMVMLGYETTLPVTVEEMLHHVKAVVRGSRRAHIVADLPFLSYQTSPEEAVRHAGRFLKEGGAQSVKLEGGEEIAPVVRRLVWAGIPVMGHLGVTPQAIHQLGGYRVQGRSREDGLALSSRNIYLSPEQREQARALSRSLELARRLILEEGVRDAREVRGRVQAYLCSTPGIALDYVSVAHPETLEEVERIEGAVLVLVAARVGTARLIDNMLIS